MGTQGLADGHPEAAFGVTAGTMAGPRYDEADEAIGAGRRAPFFDENLPKRARAVLNSLEIDIANANA
jgi:hypothetical protein